MAGHHLTPHFELITMCLTCTPDDEGGHHLTPHFELITMCLTCTPDDEGGVTPSHTTL